MHLFVGMRGIKQHLDQIIRDLQAQYFEIIAKDAKGKKVTNAVQLAVRPFQLYELVFPKDSLQDVMRMLELKGDDQDIMVSQKPLKRYFAWIRKFLGAKKLPKVESGPKRIIAPASRNHVQIVGLGYKEDTDVTYGGLTYEGL